MTVIIPEHADPSVIIGTFSITEDIGSSPLLVVILSYLSSISVHILMNASKLVFSDDGDNFRVISVGNQQDVLEIYLQGITRSAACQNYCITSKKIHSCYTRKIADLPVFGKTSMIIFRSPKFYCDQNECPFKVFTERFDNHFKPYKRRTERLEGKISKLGLPAGGRSAQRICVILSMPTSDTTILRLIEKSDFSPTEGVTAIRVDDWAYKKNKSYGSILVNLHIGKVINLLTDRDQGTLRKLLQERLEIEVMSRIDIVTIKKLLLAVLPNLSRPPIFGIC